VSETESKTPNTLQKEIISSSSGHELIKEWNDNIVWLTYKHYPLKGYANYEGYVIMADMTEYKSIGVKRSVMVKYIHNNWNGTGSTVIAEVDNMPEDEFMRLFNALKSVKSLDEFSMLKDEIIKIDESLTKKVSEAVKEVVLELSKLVSDAKVLEVLKDKDAVLDIIYDYVAD